ncbi:OLC1v1029238C1 [Oldenlandia corymbosa var. corymbosa]|uniref:OLC1v1029238C1 n=1 Tax=Oldenlandia corymbosa var. corymbosa TaxID=529605 RepID=A0AAV1CDY6_OLDCO|nr:OLC1v1029238C1 [Oldenlandia corymbosa var. corymbosa]
MGEAFLWLLFFLILICLVAMVIYQLVCLSDLELDYINPYDSARRINMVILPEFITQAVLGILFLLTGHWFMALLSIPYAYYNFRLYAQREHLIDVTEIFNLLDREKQRRIFKLGYIALLIVTNLFWLIYTALEDDDNIV